MITKNIFIILMLAVVTGMCFAQTGTPANTPAGVTQQVQGAGMIDWTDQVVQSTGIGALNPKLPPSAQRKNALRAAQLDAMRNMIETLQGVNLSSETTVENAMTTSDVIKTKVEGVVKNFRFTAKPRYMSDGSVEVDMEMYLYGKVGDVLYPQNMGGKTPTFAAVPNPPQEPQPWTGLIVDASEVADAQPAMVPNVLDETGEGIYGEEFVPRESAVKYGVVEYAKTLDDARKMSDRIGTNPLVVKAIRASGLNKADLVISDKDVDEVATIADNTEVYENCKVIIVLNK